MSVTFRFWLWWLWPYLTIGVAVLFWVAWRAQRDVDSGRSYWHILTGGGYSNERRWHIRAASMLVTVVAWPPAVWEALR